MRVGGGGRVVKDGIVGGPVPDESGFVVAAVEQVVGMVYVVDHSGLACFEGMVGRWVVVLGARL